MASCIQMRRSKLELYQDIICTLAKKALTLDSLAFECDTDCVLLQDKLEFLVNHDLVSIEVGRDNRAFFVLSRRGVSVAKTLTIAKRLERLQTSPQQSAQTLQATSAPKQAAAKAKRAI